MEGDGLNTMDTGSLLLANQFRYGGRNNENGLSAGNSVLASEAHANGTATKEAINCNKELQGAQLDRISDQNRESRDNFRFAQIEKSTTDAEFRNIDRMTAQTQLITDGQKEAAKCCCDAKVQALEIGGETQKLILSESTRTRELILAVEGRANVRLLDSANAKISQLEIINALSHRP